MSILRVVLNEPLSATTVAAWSLFDAQGRVRQRGYGAPATWPQSDSREAVCAASTVRVVSLTLPPMPADRIPAAVAYALEDQLAGPVQAQHLSVTGRDAQGRIQVVIADRKFVAALHSGFARIVAEPTLPPLPAAGRWRWFASAGGGGFVRRSDGSAFAVGAADTGGPVPDDLALAIAHAKRSGQAPTAIDAAFAVDAAGLAAWTAQCGIAFAHADAWQWDDDAALIAVAPELVDQSRDAKNADRPDARTGRGWRMATAIAGAALALHIGATIAQWAILRVDLWRASREIVAVAARSGVDAPDAAGAATGLGKRFAEARHRAALAAPGDALPLLARAAPALGVLPPGTLRSATYAPEHWTFDMSKIDPAMQSTLDRNLSNAGLATVQAVTASGVRARIALAPGAGIPR